MFLPLVPRSGFETVERKLLESHMRIEARRVLLDQWAGEYELSRALELLKRSSRMLERRVDDEAFHPLTELELAVLERQIKQYQNEGRFQVLDDRDLLGYYEVIRYHQLTEDDHILPGEFRGASDEITNRIFDYVETIVASSSQRTSTACMKKYNTVVMPVWRAGLSFVDAAYNHGFRNFAHLGVSRDEKTLETIVPPYFREFPDCVDLSCPENNQGTNVIISDSMFASGNTHAYAIQKELKSLGFQEENIIILAVITAPEGVHHILNRFPKVKIITGCHDERLNSRGYIEPGSGDYGDRWFAEPPLKRIARWREKGILTPRGENALFEKMGLVPPSR